MNIDAIGNINHERNKTVNIIASQISDCKRELEGLFAFRFPAIHSSWEKIKSADGKAFEHR